MPSSRTRAASSCRLASRLPRDQDRRAPEGAAYDAADGPELWTDGACSGNPGPGGWAALLRWNGQERELTGGETLTTNNRMELMAVLEGLRALKRPVEVRRAHRLGLRAARVRRGLAGALAAQRLAHVGQEAGGEPRPLGGDARGGAPPHRALRARARPRRRRAQRARRRARGRRPRARRRCPPDPNRRRLRARSRRAILPRFRHRQEEHVLAQARPQEAGRSPREEAQAGPDPGRSDPLHERRHAQALPVGAREDPRPTDDRPVPAPAGARRS